MMTRLRALEAENRRLRRLVITDELTGAYNRRHLWTMLQSLARLRSHGQHLVLCLFDVDAFKNFNDTHGHLRGDEALCAVVKAVGGQLRRASDNLFRLGGDEFCVMFWTSAPEHAVALANRMRDAVRAMPGPDGRPAAWGLTASFGLAWFQRPQEAARCSEQLYAAADVALYEAKKAGRDCVRVNPIA